MLRGGLPALDGQLARAVWGMANGVCSTSACAASGWGSAASGTNVSCALGIRTISTSAPSRQAAHSNASADPIGPKIEQRNMPRLRTRDFYHRRCATVVLPATHIVDGCAVIMHCGSVACRCYCVAPCRSLTTADEPAQQPIVSLTQDARGWGRWDQLPHSLHSTPCRAPIVALHQSPIPHQCFARVVDRLRTVSDADPPLQASRT